MTRSLGQRLHRRLGICVLFAALGASTAAQAAPDSNDAVARFLSEKGLLNAPVSSSPAEPPVSPAQTPSFVQQMRAKASDVASDLVLSAMHFLGVPYKRGGQSEEAGFDCSGFTRHIFELSLGLVLPRRSEEQAHAPGLLSVKRDELKPGDLVFFNTVRRTFSHVGIYVGEGKFIHSPRTGGEVRIEDMRAAYWTKRYNGARRAPPVAAGGAGSRVPEPPAATIASPAAPANTAPMVGMSLPAAVSTGLGAPRPSLAPHPSL